MTDVKMDWISKHPTIEHVAKFCQPTKTVSEVLGDHDHVHLLVVAEEEIGANEERDVVEELWPQVTFRREPQVLVPNSQVALTPHPLRLL